MTGQTSFMIIISASTLIFLITKIDFYNFNVLEILNFKKYTILICMSLNSYYDLIFKELLLFKSSVLKTVRDCAAGPACTVPSSLNCEP